MYLWRRPPCNLSVYTPCVENNVDAAHEMRRELMWKSGRIENMMNNRRARLLISARAISGEILSSWTIREIARWNADFGVFTEIIWRNKCDSRRYEMITVVKLALAEYDNAEIAAARRWQRLERRAMPAQAAEQPASSRAAAYINMNNIMQDLMPAERRSRRRLWRRD